jgi:hypothetical protein
MPEEATPEKHFRKSMVLIPAAIVAAALVGVWIYQAFDLSGTQARKFADAKRELNNELDAQLRSTDPHCCGWKPHWEASGASTNPIDGTKTECLTTESVTPDGADADSLHYAELQMCFQNGRLCSGRTVGVAFDVHGMVEPAGYGSDEEDSSTSVRVRFDEEKLARQTWGITEDHEALYPSGHQKQFPGQLMQYNKLVLEFSYYEQTPRSVTFDLSGLADKMKSDNLVP